MSTFSRSFDSVSPAPLDQLEDSTDGHSSFELVGDSPATQQLRLQIERIGPHFRSVLVQGEIGSGKEWVARALHAKIRGFAGPFIPCHGLALDAALCNDDGDAADSPWHPLVAGQPGTIFLNGVDVLSPRAQARLFKLRRWSFRRSMPSRMIATTCQSLKKMLRAGRFQPDLYQQLATIEIVIEPLRERREDIPVLAEHLVRRFATVYEKGPMAISDSAMTRLGRYDWPGNVREMENVLRNSVLKCEHHALGISDLDSLLNIRENFTPRANQSDKAEKLEEVVERHVLHVLQLCSGNKVRAAEMLGISRSTLYRMLVNWTDIRANGR